MLRRQSTRWSLVLALMLLPSLSHGREPYRYPEGKHGKAELRYINQVPVLFVEGTPEEIGEQIATLAGKPSERLLSYPRDLLKEYYAHITWPVLVSTGKKMVPQFPDDQRRELEAMSKAGINFDSLIVANTMFDVVKLVACSSIIIDKDRSATGEPLFGRNLDFPTAGYLQEYSLLTIYKPKGKHAFASIGFPGLVGCLSGVNDAGLSVAILEVLDAADGSKKFDIKGTPYAMNYRRILEECTTVAEAERVLRSMKRTTRNNLAVCDRNGGVVFEITPDNVVARKCVEGVCPCTNHFCSRELAPDRIENKVYTRDRFDALVSEASKYKAIGLPEVAQILHAANGGDCTLQTMIFEPARMRLHLAIGSCPSTVLPLRTIDLEPLLRASAAKVGN